MSIEKLSRHNEINFSKQKNSPFAATGLDFYDYECESKAIWKVWHKEDL